MKLNNTLKVKQMAHSKEHYHKTENGVLVKCYHKCKGLLTDPAFWIGMTISYPFEHMLWEKVPGFSHLAHLMGMH